MNPWAALLSLSGMGFFVAVSIILGILGGKWLDSKLNTSPLCLIIGLVVGLFVAVFGAYNMLKPFLDNDKKDKGNK